MLCLGTSSNGSWAGWLFLYLQVGRMFFTTKVCGDVQVFGRRGFIHRLHRLHRWFLCSYEAKQEKLKRPELHALQSLHGKKRFQPLSQLKTIIKSNPLRTLRVLVVKINPKVKGSRYAYQSIASVAGWFHSLRLFGVQCPPPVEK